MWISPAARCQFRPLIPPTPITWLSLSPPAPVRPLSPVPPFLLKFGTVTASALSPASQNQILTFKFSAVAATLFSAPQENRYLCWSETSVNSFIVKATTVSTSIRTFGGFYSLPFTSVSSDYQRWVLLAPEVALANVIFTESKLNISLSLS